jgi:hypothetical protein
MKNTGAIRVSTRRRLFMTTTPCDITPHSIDKIASSVPRVSKTHLLNPLRDRSATHCDNVFAATTGLFLHSKKDAAPFAHAPGS